VSGVASAAASSMPAALGARQGLRIWHTRAASAGLANMYFIAPKTSASDEAGLKTTFNARAAGGLGGTFPPAASRMTLRVKHEGLIMPQRAKLCQLLGDGHIM
jgi:hypothetical protein